MRFHGVVIPCVTLDWLEMHEYFSTHWRHGCGIEGVCALHGFERQQLGVDRTGAHHVECDVALLSHAAPVGHAERLRGTSSCG